MLRSLLHPVFAAAHSWQELHQQLRDHGFELAFQRGRLVLLCSISGLAICTTRFLGFPLNLLVGRLGKVSAYATDDMGSGKLMM
ncbi:MAG: hypothetical protein D6832_04990 [Alphaproteobacteria bacterium]|nr:MAG: hypothetical protein D6832_04990 [Alphaproteobacteria bacterium]